jgi:hypothetical protein
MASIGMKGPYEGMKSGGMKVRQTPNLTPQQMKLLSQGMENVNPQSYLSQLASGDEELFNQMEAPALRQFSGLQGNMASRFSGMGMGGRRSSGFQNSMGAAASDFAQQLQGNRQNLQRQAIQDLHGMSQDLLNQRPYNTRLEERRPKQSFWQKAAPWAGAAVGGLAGGPSGALAGYQVGNSFSGAGGGQQSFKNDLPQSWGSFGDQINQYLPLMGSV